MSIQKQRRHESQKLKDSAKGQDCTIRLPGICNFRPETTVLCHLNGGGTGTKKSDLFAAFGCSDCHNEVDRKTRKLPLEEAQAAHYEGMVRTQQYWLDNGFVTLK
jgi:hypothetical protein